MAWPIVQFNGEPHYQGTGTMLVPVNGTGVAVVMMREDGGVMGGVSAIAQGPPGVHAELENAIAFTPLEPGDPTPDSAFFEPIAPPTESTPGRWKLHWAMHKPDKGDDGTMVWNPLDLSATPKAGWIPAVKSNLTGFELVPQRIPEVFYPGTINNIGSGNAKATHAVIDVPARPWPRRIRAQGLTVVTGESADVRVNLLARLNGEDDGNIVGRCIGIAQVDRLAFSPGKPIQAGTGADGYDTIPANASATVHIRCERQAGASTFTATAAMAHFNVEAWPL